MLMRFACRGVFSPILCEVKLRDFEKSLQDTEMKKLQTQQQNPVSCMQDGSVCIGL